MNFRKLLIDWKLLQRKCPRGSPCASYNLQIASEAFPNCWHKTLQLAQCKQRSSMNDARASKLMCLSWFIMMKRASERMVVWLVPSHWLYKRHSCIVWAWWLWLRMLSCRMSTNAAASVACWSNLWTRSSSDWDAAIRSPCIARWNSRMCMRSAM